MARTKLTARKAAAPRFSESHKKLLAKNKLINKSKKSGEGENAKERKKPKFRAITKTLRGIRDNQQDTGPSIGPCSRKRLFDNSFETDISLVPAPFGKVSVGRDALNIIAWNTDHALITNMKRCYEFMYYKGKSTLKQSDFESQFYTWCEDNSPNSWSHFLKLKAKYYKPTEGVRVDKQVSSINFRKYRSKPHKAAQEEE